MGRDGETPGRGSGKRGAQRELPPRRRFAILLLLVPAAAVLGFVLVLVLAADGRPEEPYVQEPIPLAEIDTGVRVVAEDGFRVQGGLSRTTLFGVESRAGIECVIESREPGLRMQLSLYRLVGGEWTLVTRTEEIEGLLGFGIRHDVRGEDPATRFKVEGIWTSGDASGAARRVVRSQLLSIERIP